MKQNKIILLWICTLVLLIKANNAHAQLATEGDWAKTTISSNLTVELTGDINLKGTITINSGCTLTIKSNGNANRTIKNTGLTASAYMFNNTGTLIIEGSSTGIITIDGGANYTWNNYTLTAGDGSKKTSAAINSTGALTLSYVNIQDVNDNNANGGALNIGSSKKTNLNYCTIQRCRSQLGSALMISNGGTNPDNNAIRISNSTIKHCISGGGTTNNSGGAIRTYGSVGANLYLTNVVMSENYSKRNSGYNGEFEKQGNGGALFWNGRNSSETTCYIDGCTFERNKCDDNGGAIKSQSSIVFTGNTTTIKENQAPNGAGIYVEGYVGGVKLTNPRTLTYDLNEKLILENNLAVSPSDYSAKGAGIHFVFSSSMTLEAKSTINININGATIKGNKVEGDGGLGGGIYFENNAPAEKNYKINVNLNHGLIERNSSSSLGGGIYIYKEDVNSTTSEDASLTISNNTAKENGGGIYIKDGNLDMSVGVLSSNTAQINGGGIYIDNGNCEITSGTITSNTATKDGGGLYISNNGSIEIKNANISENETTNGNGGGIYMLDGTVTITAGDIKNNISGKHGGGLYVCNTTSTSKNAEFNGGNIMYNKATATGGGACAEGNIMLKINGVDIEENTAINGGGISLLNGAHMDFGSGIIKGNHAKASSGYTTQTAYQKQENENQGIGGGVYLDSKTRLTFSVVNQMGLYDNIADKGANDIYSNGDETYVTLPDVSNMNLAGGPTASEGLYWVEDYVTSDINYAQGTYINKDEGYSPLRYQDALANTLPVYMPEAGEYTNYLCIALGYRILYATISKSGLQEGESAVFSFYKKDEGTGIYNYYTTILLSGIKDKDTVSKQVALSKGNWKVVETQWSWRYNLTTPNNSERSIVLDVVNDSQVFSFTNNPIETDKLKYDEAIKVNEMRYD